MRVVVLEQEAEDGEEMKRQENAEAPRTQRKAERPRRSAQAKKLALTTPDLVLLSLLAERPMHGYQANLEMERREIRGWAILSWPQLYLYVEQLVWRGMVRTDE